MYCFHKKFGINYIRGKLCGNVQDFGCENVHSFSLAPYFLCNDSIMQTHIKIKILKS